jgi:predicted nucleic acid-binding protein
MSAEFIDTNIIVYAYDLSEPHKREVARVLLERLWQKRNGCLSIQVLQELYVTLTRKLPVSLSCDQVIPLISDLGLWKHHIPNMTDIIDSARIQNKYEVSFWDAMIINSARKLDCKIIWTEDLNHGQLYEGIQAVNPFYESRD